jgi:hypothetical protein
MNGHVMARVASRGVPFRAALSPDSSRGRHLLPQTERSGAAISLSRWDDHDQRLHQIAALDRPAFVPRTTGRRQEVRRKAGASNPHVRDRIRPSLQVARSAPRTLSRWRHGFEPRWDYAGQTPCPVVARLRGPALAPRRTRNRQGTECCRCTPTEPVDRVGFLHLLQSGRHAISQGEQST